MTKLETMIKSVAAAIGVMVTYFFGGWDALVAALLTLIALDYITGIGAAAVEGKLSSRVGLIGIARKVFIFIVVAMAHVVDVVLGNDLNLVRDGVIFFYMANEAISILENGGKLGVPIPPVLRQAVEALRGKGGSGQSGPRTGGTSEGSERGGK